MLYDEAERILRENLPPVTLLMGADLGSLITLAGRLVLYHGVHRTDLIEAFAKVLTADEARAIAAFADAFPVHWAVPGGFKAVILGLDGVSEQVQNILLKPLEEPPPGVRYILLATKPPLPTIVSRSQVFRFSGFPDKAEAEEEVRGRVAIAIRAAQGDASQLAAACKDWDEDCTTVLVAWAGEAASGRWSRFTADFAPGVSPAQALGVLEGLGRAPRARPVNAAILALGRAFGR